MMSNVLRALLISAAATGVFAVVLNALDLDAVDSSAPEDPFTGMDPDDLSEAEVDALMKELASQLSL